MKIQGFFGRKDTTGNVIVFNADGSDATFMDEIEGASSIYPVDSNTSLCHEHADGIVLSLYDAKKIGLEIEE